MAKTQARIGNASSPRWLIGLDAASNRKKFGWALAELHGSTASLEDFGLLADGDARLPERLVAALKDPDGALVAIDAPLGWPALLGETLAHHRAGNVVDGAKDELFRRSTDKVVQRTTGKRPLEVGADRIARASVEALAVLGELRVRSGKALPLSWASADAVDRVIEVYPGATLVAHGIKAPGYKASNEGGGRSAIIKAFQRRLKGLDALVAAKADVLDACLCVIAAMDFLDGLCVQPSSEQRRIGEIEGWIWVNDRSTDRSD